MLDTLRFWTVINNIVLSFLSFYFQPLNFSFMVLLHFQITLGFYNLIYSKGYILHNCFNRTSSYSQRLISGDIT